MICELTNREPFVDEIRSFPHPWFSRSTPSLQALELMRTLRARVGPEEKCGNRQRAGCSETGRQAAYSISGSFLAKENPRVRLNLECVAEATGKIGLV